MPPVGIMASSDAQLGMVVKQNLPMHMYEYCYELR